MRLAEAGTDRRNNLNLIRMVAAIGVLVSHAYPIALGPAAEQPLSKLLGMTLGHLSVTVFFVISGFLIAASAVRGRSLYHWFAGRVLRLFPALIVVVVITALIIGPLVSTLPVPGYFGDVEVLTYVVRNITLVSLQYPLPGVFVDNPYGSAINGSLWTLFYEVACYMGVFVLALLGVLRSKGVALLVLAAVFGFYTLLRVTGLEHLHPRIEAGLSLGFPFGVGMLFFVLRERVRLTWPIGVLVAAGALAATWTPFFHEVFVMTLAYWIFLLAYRPKGRVLGYNRLGDYSYGVYLYAFPIQQGWVWLLGDMTPVLNMAMSLPMVILAAIFSWRYVERPALAAKQRWGDDLQRRFGGKPRRAAG